MLIGMPPFGAGMGTFELKESQLSCLMASEWLNDEVRG